MLYPSGYWLVWWWDKKGACSLNCLWPWRCHLATHVKLMVAFAAHSTPTGLPSTHCFVFVYLYFSTCIFVFVHLWAWWPINPPLCVCVFSFIIHFCICNADGCLCCPLNPTGPPSTHHFVFVNLCFFGVFVKLIVAFADYSNPLDYHQPTALHLCKCVFAFFFCRHVFFSHETITLFVKQLAIDKSLIFLSLIINHSCPFLLFQLYPKS